MKSNFKWFFKITTITSYVKITWKIKKNGPLESLKGKVISNSSFTLSNFLCVARNLGKKNEPFVPRDKNDQIIGAVIIHQKFDARTKHLSATDGQLKVFLGPCGWRNSIFKSPSCTFISLTMPQCYRKLCPLSSWINIFMVESS